MSAIIVVRVVLTAIAVLGTVVGTRMVFRYARFSTDESILLVFAKAVLAFTVSLCCALTLVVVGSTYVWTIVPIAAGLYAAIKFLPKPPPVMETDGGN